jgi:hypothetical protein
MSIRHRFESGVATAIAMAVVLSAPRARGDVPDAQSPPATASDEALTQYRDRFKLGMDRYKAGLAAEAIGYWAPIFGDLGPQRGYRLAYDLGIAYAQIGDATRAAERFQSFLDEVDARRGRGESLEGLVTREEEDARDRMAAMRASKAQIRVAEGAVPIGVQVDGDEPRLAGFVAWVAPGTHSVTFAPGTGRAETKAVAAAAGEVVDVAPTPPENVETPALPPAASAPPLPFPSPTPSTSSPASGAAPAERPGRERPPFSPAWLYAGGGLTLGVTIAAIVLEVEANALRDRLIGERPRSNGTIPADERRTFVTTRTWAYASVGSAIALAGATASLGIAYGIGRGHREARVIPAAAVTDKGAWVGLRLAF